MRTHHGTPVSQPPPDSDNRQGRLCVLTSFAGNAQAQLAPHAYCGPPTQIHHNTYPCPCAGAGTGVGAKLRQTTVYPDALFHINNADLSLKVCINHLHQKPERAGHHSHPCETQRPSRSPSYPCFLLAVRSALGRGRTPTDVMHFRAGLSFLLASKAKSCWLARHLGCGSCQNLWKFPLKRPKVCIAQGRGRTQKGQTTLTLCLRAHGGRRQDSRFQSPVRVCAQVVPRKQAFNWTLES